MDILAMLSSVQYIPVLVAVVVAHILGTMRYHPAVFGKKWMAAHGIDVKNSMKDMGRVMSISFITTFFVALCIALLAGGAGLQSGLMIGAILAIGVVFMNRLMHYTYAGKSWELLLIDSGYDLLTFLVMGAIIGVW